MHFFLHFMLRANLMLIFLHLPMNSTFFLRSVLCAFMTLSLVSLTSCSSTRSPAPGASAGGPVTAGLRSGSFALSKDSVDNLLQDRPGLGTQAGHDLQSRVVTSRLIRKSNVPDAVDSFHYNDEKGAQAMVGILGGSTSKHSGLFSAAGDRLKVGLLTYGSIYPHFDARGRRIVIGDAGYNYSVRLENRTKKRVEVIVSVDGLSTLTGKAASPTQRGYVLEPKESYEVEGFRKNATTVTSFRFGRVADSVAAAKGGARNVGVIGLAVYEEDEARAQAELQREQFVRDNANAFPVGGE